MALAEERFQINVTKFRGNQNPSILNIEVKSLRQDADENQQVTTLVTLNVLEPQAKFIRVENLNDLSSEQSCFRATVSGCVSELGKYSDDLKSQRKSIGGILPLADSIACPNLPLQSVIVPEYSAGKVPKFIQINVRDLKYHEKLTILLDKVTNEVAPNECSDEDANNNIESAIPGESVASEAISPEIRAGGLDSDNANIELSEEKFGVSEKSVDEENSNEKNVKIETIEIPEVGLDGIQAESSEIEMSPSSDLRPSLTPPNFTLTIGNALLITFGVDPNPGNFEGLEEIAIDDLNNNPRWTAPIPDPSEESVIEPGTIIDSNWPNNKVQDPPVVQEQVAVQKAKQIETKNKLFKTLIYERILAFGLPYDEAHSITDTWNLGCAQRACSIRVPKTLPKWTAPAGLNPTLDKEAKAEAFAYNFLRHTEILQGIIDSATCTVIEATFFLMLPHFNMSVHRRNSSTIESLTSMTFIKDWVQIVFAAAHQLKPSESHSVSGLIGKETKLLRKLIRNVKKTSSKIKKKFKVVQENVDHLKRKVLSRIEPNPVWTADILERNKKSNAKGAAEQKTAGSIQIPEDLTAETLFENYIHIGAGRKGLVFKRHLKDPWHQFASLNFTERRVILLGLTDHMHSTFDSLLRTLRHLQEMYTPGYPLNIITRINVLFELLRDKSHPYEQLSPQRRSVIYTKIHNLAEAVDRFCYTFGQLSKFHKEAHRQLVTTWFVPGVSTEFIEQLCQERHHINLVVPFTKLALAGIMETKFRGRGLPHEKLAGDEETPALETLGPEPNPTNNVVETNNATEN